MCILMLASPGCKKQSGTQTGSSTANSPSGEPWFEEIAQGRGPTFRHESPVPDRYLLPETIPGGAALLDIDNDGDLDLAVASDDGFLYVWDLPNTFNPDNISWGGLFNDSEHSNANLVSLPATSPGSQLMPGKLVYNYPNPTEGNATTIRYTLNSPAQVKIKIYDLAGRLVDELQGTGFGQENEVVWGLENIESGVYLARVEADGDGNKDAAIIKIAVVK
ncbi:T9SS type A sorting domain-containing protein [candidate division KSB1 bacterium]|nr:T9SS type A sorting domain-containing protein [candidate division KSB1 bacterium]